MPRFIIEQVTQVWDNDVSECYRIGADGEGHGLVELTLLNDDGSPRMNFLFDPEMAILIADALDKHGRKLNETKEAFG